jgi:hypothetical protein
MRILGLAVALAVVAYGEVASAAPLAVRHGRSIQVSLVAGRTEEAFALRPSAGGGWRLDVAGAAAGTTLALRDVTGGMTAAPRFELGFVAGGVVLDTARFRADHAYRLELRRGPVVLGSALIYLQPPRHGNGRVVFDDRDAATSDDELSTLDKGAL